MPIKLDIPCKRIAAAYVLVIPGRSSPDLRVALEGIDETQLYLLLDPEKFCEAHDHPWNLDDPRVYDSISVDKFCKYHGLTVTHEE